MLAVVEGVNHVRHVAERRCSITNLSRRQARLNRTKLSKGKRDENFGQAPSPEPLRGESYSRLPSGTANGPRSSCFARRGSRGVRRRILVPRQEICGALRSMWLMPTLACYHAVGQTHDRRIMPPSMSADEAKIYLPHNLSAGNPAPAAVCLTRFLALLSG